MDRNKIFIRQMIKYSILVLAVMLLYVIQTTPNLFEFFGVKPNFIIPFCIVLTFFEYESPVLFVYITAGFMNEMAMSRLIGFHTILIIMLAVAGNIISTYYLNPNTRNTTIYSFLSMIIILSIDFLFVYIMGGLSGIMPTFIQNVVLTSLVSTPFCILYYHFIRFIFNRFIRYDAR